MRKNIIVAGIDGGGTGTRAVLINEFGKVLGTGISGGSSIDTIALRDTSKSIFEALDKAWNDSGVEKKLLDSIVIGLGGGLTVSDCKKIEQYFERHDFVVQNMIKIVNDAEVALFGGLLDELGIVLISGIDSVCYGRNFDGEEWKVGGCGCISENQGSCYNIGLNAILHVLQCHDGSKVDTGLADKILNFVGVNDANELNEMLYNKKMNRTNIAKIASIVLDRFEDADLNAIEIIDKGIDELINMVKEVTTRIHKENEKIKLVKSGEMFLSNSAFSNTFCKRLEEKINNVEVVEPNFSPVIGAGIMALKRIGINLSEKDIVEKNKYIMKLKPHFKKKIWGWEKWNLSCHRDGEAIIENGIFKGKKLSGIYKTCPILIKVLNTNKDLSVQVHPDDAYARKYENDNGKNECWYIVEAEKGAKIITGIKNEIDRESFIDKIKTNEIENCLYSIDVEQGDFIYIPAGTVHGIGKGIKLIEVQQSSNVTYRLHDWGRKRKIHLKKSLDVINFSENKNREKTDDFKKLSTPQFEVEKLHVKAEKMDQVSENFRSYTVINGSGTITSASEIICIKSEDTVFIPKGIEYCIDGTMELIRVESTNWT